MPLTAENQDNSQLIRCRSCAKAIRQAYNLAHREHRRQWGKQYHISHREKHVADSRKYYDIHKEEINSRNKTPAKRKRFAELARGYRRQYPERYHIQRKQLEERVRVLTPYKWWAQNTIHGHRKRGFDVQLTVGQLEDLAKATSNCCICNVPFDWGFSSNKERMREPSLDRINNAHILTIGSVQIICVKCNLTKGNRTMREFVRYCKGVSDKHESKSNELQ